MTEPVLIPGLVALVDPVTGRFSDSLAPPSVAANTATAAAAATAAASAKTAAETAQTAAQAAKVAAETAAATVIAVNADAVTVDNLGQATTTAKAFLKAADDTAARTAIAAVGKADVPFNVKDYGATGDGATDDTAAIQAVVNLLSASGSTIPSISATLPPGTYKITDTITVQRKGFYLRGSGCGNSPQATNPGKGTRIVWAGPAGKPMFRVYDAFNFLIEDLCIVGHNTNTPSEGIFFESTASEPGGNNGSLYLNRVTFGKTRENGTNWKMDYCVRFGGLNANNDQFRFDDCLFVQPTTACVQIDQTQTIWGLFVNAFFQGNFTAKGLRTNSSTHLVNATFDSCLIDFELGFSASTSPQVSVNGYYSERGIKSVYMPRHASRFEAVGGLVGTQYAEIDYTPAGDGEFITADSLQAEGAISLDGVKFYSYTGGTRAKIKVRGPSIGAAIGGGVFIKNCNLTRSLLDLTCANNRGIFVAWDDDHLFNRKDIINGATWAPIDSLSGAQPPQVDVYTSSGTWTKPAGASTVQVTCIGPGGGGGSGRRGAAGTIRCGGGGGGGGGLSYATIPATSLGSTVAVTVGTGGAGGAAITGDDTNGSNGSNGSSSTVFGSVVRAGAGLAGGGGTATTGTGGAAGGGTSTGGIGQTASATGGVGPTAATGAAASGGPPGGGITSANVASNGGVGAGSGSVISTAPAGGVVDTTAPAAAPTGIAGAALPGGSGGGGAASITTAAQAGATAGVYGGGGSGGGAALNGNNSGAGGAGANGIVVVVTYF